VGAWGGYGATQRSGIVIFGYTEAQIAGFFLTYGVGAFILFMVFIIGHLAWESKAGRFGTFVIFLGLGVGFLGFLAKYVIQWWLERR
jgi:hypothetical protein